MTDGNHSLSNQMINLETNVIETMADIESKLLEALSGSATVTVESLYKQYLLFKKNTLNSIADIKKKVSIVEERSENMEMYSRKNCLVLHGIEEQQNEDVIQIVTHFIHSKLNLTDFNVTGRVFDNIHRLGKKSTTNKRPRPVIVKFVSYLDRKKVWNNKKALKGTGFLITESLTRGNALLYDGAKEIFGRKSTWTVDGRIYIVLPNNKKLMIRNNCDLEEARKELESQTLGAKKKTYALRNQAALRN